LEGFRRRSAALVAGHRGADAAHQQRAADRPGRRRGRRAEEGAAATALLRWRLHWRALLGVARLDVALLTITWLTVTRLTCALLGWVELVAVVRARNGGSMYGCSRLHVLNQV